MSAASDQRLTDLIHARTFARLRDRPETRAGAIASHYCGYQAQALALHRLAQVQKHCGPDPKIDALIERIVKQISDGHREDLGIALEWPRLTNGALPHGENSKAEEPRSSARG